MLAYTVNRLGTWFGYVALSIAVFDHTHSALAVAAVLVAGQVLSAFLVPAVVARIEAHPARGGLTVLYVFETLATIALALVILLGFSLPVVLVLVALDGTAALAASALLRTAAARSAREWAYADAGEADDDGALEAAALEAERVANAALNIGFAMTFTLGPAIAGLIVPAFGAPAALFIDAATFLLCGALLLDLIPHVEETEASSVRERVAAAWRYIGESRALRHLLGAEGVALAFFTFSGPVEVAYAKASLHAGDGGYGLLVGVWGLGVTIGSIVFARSIGRSLGTLLSSSTLAVGLAYRFGPNHGPTRPPFLSWGLLVAVLLWAAAARAFMLYLAHFPSYNRVYGSIGAVVVLLIWLYVSAYAVLLGAAVDAERQRRKPVQ